MDKFENIIIGFGKAGKTLAKTLANKSTVALIEQSTTMYGGTCINEGCIPSKYLLEQAIQNIPFEKAMTNKNKMVEQLRKKNYDMIANLSNCKVIDGKAKLLNTTQVEITDKDGKKQVIQGQNIFINTGAKTVLPTIPGLKLSKNILTSRELLNLTTLPKKLLIIGAGYIGLEFATTFRLFGASVKVIETNATFLSREDDDMSKRIYEDISATGVSIDLGITIQNIADGEQVVVTYIDKDGTKKQEKADKLLVATGRRPNIEELGLNNAGVDITANGAIQVDDNLATSVPNIYALGDVTGGLQFTYTSLDDFRIVASHIFSDNSYKRSDRTVVPYSVFIVPTFSSVGLNEKSANQRSIDYKLYQIEIANTPKGNLINEPKGCMKVLVDKKTNYILGANIYASHSQELINFIALAIKNNLPYTVLKDGIFTHPSMTECFNDLFK